MIEIEGEVSRAQMCDRCSGSCELGSKSGHEQVPPKASKGATPDYLARYTLTIRDLHSIQGRRESRPIHN